MIDFERILAQLHRNRNALRARAGRYAGDVPLPLQNQLDDHDAAIDLTEAALRRDLSSDEWLTRLKRLALGVDLTGVFNQAEAQLDRAAALAAYGRALLEETRFVSLRGIPLPPDLIGLTVPLDAIYIKLQAVARHQAEQQRHDELEGLTREERANQTEQDRSLASLRLLAEHLYYQGETYRSDQRPQPVDPEAALAQHQRLVILGAPGSGKSTLLRFLARRLIVPQAEADENNVIPILVSLRDYAVALSQSANYSLRAFALDRAAGGDDQLRAALEARVNDSQVLWLLDALDEAHGYGPDIIHQTSRLPGRLVLTSRPLGYPPDLAGRLAHFEILPLAPANVDQFLTDWFALLADYLGQDDNWAAERRQVLGTQLKTRPRLQPLLRNPLLLTFVAGLAGPDQSQTLPEERSALYRAYIEALLTGREADRRLGRDAEGYHQLRLGSRQGQAAVDLLRQGLYYLGWRLQLAYYGGQIETLPDEATLVGDLARYLDRSRVDPGTATLPTLAHEILQFWQQAGLIDTWRLTGRTYLAFRHLTFQEYATGQALVLAWTRDRKQTWAFLWPRLHVAVWREPILIFSALLPDPERTRLIRQLIKGVSPYEGSLYRDRRLVVAMIGENNTIANDVVETIAARLLRLGQPTNQSGGPAWLMALIGRFPRWQSTLWLPARRRPAWLQTLAQESLGDIRHPAVIPYLLPLLEAQGSPLYQLTNRALTRFDTETTLPHLIPLLHSPSSILRRRAAEIMGRSGADAAIPHLIALLHDSDSEIRTRATSALAHIRSEAMILPLTALLQHPNADIRYAATWTLSQLGSAAMIPYFIPLLEDEYHYTREVAAKALSRIGNETILPQLIPLLSHQVADVRCRVVEIVGQIGGEALLPQLEALLQDPDARVRRQVLEVLSRFSRTTIMPILVPLLQDADADMRAGVAEILSQLDGEAIVPHLTPLLQDQNLNVSKRVAKIVGRLGSEAAIAQLLPMVDDERWPVRQQVLEIVDRLAGEATIPQLVPLLSHPNGHVRNRMARALGQIGCRAAIPHLLPLLDDERGEIREAAAWALSQLGSEAAIPHLLPLVRYSDPDVHLWAEEALGRIDGEAVIPALVPLLDDKDADVRLRVAKLSGQFGHKAAVLPLTTLLEDENSQVRSAAVEALKHLDSEALIARLLTLLQHPQAAIRQLAVWEVGRLGGEAVVPLLLPRLDDPEADIRWRAVNALSQLGGKAMIPRFIPMLQDRSSEVRRRVAAVLGHLGGKALLPQLLPLLDDKDWQVRQTMIRVLGAIGDETVIPFLLPLLKDRAGDTYWQAAETLSRLGNEPVIDYFSSLLTDANPDMRWQAARQLEQLVSQTTNRAALKKAARALWWRLTDITPHPRWANTTVVDEAWPAFERTVQRLTDLTIENTPASDILI